MKLRQALYFGAHRMIGSRLGQVYEDYLRQDALGVSGDMANESLARILDHCERHVPYYADLMAGNGAPDAPNSIARLQRYPILTKDLIRKHFDRLTSRDLATRRWRYSQSGGSTGEPIKFIQDRAFMDRQSAAAMLVRTWAGRAFGEPGIYLWGSGRDLVRGSTGLKITILNGLSNDRFLDAYRMTPARMRSYLQELNATPVKLIIAFSSAIYELAVFAESEGIAVRAQTAIMTTGDTLYPHMRDKVESVFGCKVFNHYGSQEVGAIACECQGHRGLHVLPWTNYVEIVDDQGQPVPRGVEGNIVVTNLTNYAMPLIRYAIGDRGVLAPGATCACGRCGQILAAIAGRVTDSFRKADGTVISGAGGPLEGFLFYKPWVRQYQIVQKDYHQIVYRIVRSGSDCPPEDLRAIVTFTKIVMGEDCQVDFEFPEEIAPMPSGKMRYTICEIGR
jgi:phenylacetate-CoA ligase